MLSLKLVERKEKGQGSSWLIAHFAFATISFLLFQAERTKLVPLSSLSDLSFLRAWSPTVHLEAFDLLSSFFPLLCHPSPATNLEHSFARMAEVPRLQIDHELKAVAPALSPSSSYIGNHIFSPLISKVRQLSPFSQGIQVETSSIFPQHALRPDAPWITFLDKRNNLLDAYHLLYPSDKIDTTLTDDELRQAFVQFSLSLDSITTPHE